MERHFYQTMADRYCTHLHCVVYFHHFDLAVWII